MNSLTRFAQTLKSLLTGLMSYLLALDVPTFTQSIAAGVLWLLTMPLQILLHAVSICPPRLLICLTLIALLLLGAWIT